MQKLQENWRRQTMLLTMHGHWMALTPTQSKQRSASSSSSRNRAPQRASRTRSCPAAMAQQNACSDCAAERLQGGDD